MAFNNKEYLGNTSLEFDHVGEVTESDVKIATLLLFVSCASCDGILDSTELRLIVDLSAKEFDIKEMEVVEILQIARVLSSQKTNLDSFITKINTKFSLEQKQLIMMQSWKLILSNAKVDKLEAQLAAKYRQELGLTLEAAVRARKLAEIEILETKNKIIKKLDVD